MSTATSDTSPTSSKRAVSLVVIEKLDHGIIGDEEIDVAIAIIVGDGHAKSLSRLAKADLLRDLGEGPVLIIVIDERGNRLEEVGMAIRAVAFFVFAAPDVVEIPIQIAKDDQIQKPVAIQIDPRRAGGPPASRDAGLLRHVGERAVAVVVVELVAAIGGYIKILESVVVVVADGNAHAVSGSLQAGLLGDVLESSRPVSDGKDDSSTGDPSFAGL